MSAPSFVQDSGARSWARVESAYFVTQLAAGAGAHSSPLGLVLAALAPRFLLRSRNLLRSLAEENPLLSVSIARSAR